MSQVFIPSNIQEACQLLAQPNRVCVAGATNLYVDRYEGRSLEKDIVSIHKLKELKNISCQEDGWHIGSLVTFDQLEQTFLSEAANTDNHSVIPAALKALGKAASLVGGPQVRNRGTIGGNLVSASPSADTVPVLMTMDATVCLESVDGKRTLPVREFMVGVKKTAIQENELLTEIFIPHPIGNALFEKTGTRNALAIAVCNLCVMLNHSSDDINESEDSNARDRIQNISIAIGSCAPTCVRAEATEKALSGCSKPQTGQDWLAIKKIIRETLPMDISPIDDVRATKSYREKVAGNLTYKLVKELWEV